MAGSEGSLTGKVLGSYRIGELIGVGQLAEVYQAQHSGLPQPVALKVFAPSVAANAAYTSNMRAIAVRASLLMARNILPIHGFAQEGNTLFLSMPLMRESLRAALLRASRLPVYHAVPLLGQIAYGLSGAHAAGILHLDLKPENVLLDAQGQAFVSDFGVGRDLSAESEDAAHMSGTLTSLIGTPVYMAPEQLRGQTTDQRTDVYALGVIFYEMLTGMPPYSGRTIYEVAAQALTTPIPPPSQRAPGITPALEQVILRALARDPAERWPTVQQFITGLNAALPIRAYATDAPELTQNSLWRELTTAPLPASDEAVLASIGAATELPLDAPDDSAQAADGESVPAVADEAAIDDAPTLTLFAHPSPPPDDDLYGNSSVVATPDLRLFRVDPLPPKPPQKQPTGLLLAGVALLLLVILGGGGVFLANAAQPRARIVATPTNPPATFAPTHATARPTVTPQPTATARAFVPPPPPTVTPQPTATATPKPTATATPKPAPTATPVPPTATP